MQVYLGLHYLEAECRIALIFLVKISITVAMDTPHAGIEGKLDQDQVEAIQPPRIEDSN